MARHKRTCKVLRLSVLESENACLSADNARLSADNARLVDENSELNARLDESRKARPSVQNNNVTFNIISSTNGTCVCDVWRHKHSGSKGCSHRKRAVQFLHRLPNLMTRHDEHERQPVLIRADAAEPSHTHVLWTQHPIERKCYEDAIASFSRNS